MDHINGDTMNNCRINLRKVTHSVNSHNVSKKKNTTSKYIGVYFDKLTNKWNVTCGRGPSYGCYDNEIYAANVYNYVAKEKWGENANLNNVELPSDFKMPIFKRCREKEERGLVYVKNNNTWQVKVNKIHYGTFKTKDEALVMLYKIRLDEKEKKHKEHLDKPIIRNANGIAIIPVKTKTEIIVYALVDDNKWHELVLTSWSLQNGYAKCRSGFMHHKILPMKHGFIIDHIEQNKLDNRETKLRYATYSQNSQNRIKAERDLPIGVRKHRNKYHTNITKDHKSYYLGSFVTPKEAGKAYDKQAIELYGIHAKLNYDISLYQ